MPSTNEVIWILNTEGDLDLETHVGSSRNTLSTLQEGMHCQDPLWTSVWQLQYIASKEDRGRPGGWRTSEAWLSSRDLEACLPFFKLDCPGAAEHRQAHAVSLLPHRTGFQSSSSSLVSARMRRLSESH